MFYEPKDGHGLPHNPFSALVAPRPIAWISTVDASGNANLAPYSFFNAVAYEPPQIMYASTSVNGRPGADGISMKDSIRNIERNGEFVVNLATWDLREAMNATSAAAPPGGDEFELAGLEKASSHIVAPPRVAASPVQMECRLVRIVDLLSKDLSAPNRAVIGEVVGIHISDLMLKDGMVDMDALQPLSRLGYMDYAVLGDRFTMRRP